MNDQLTEKNLLEIWLSSSTDSQNTAEYRLYYDDNGFPLFYSMEKKSGNYVVVTKDFYVNPPKHIRVVKGKIRVYEHTTLRKLRPSDQGTCCDPRDVCVVVDQQHEHTKWSHTQRENDKYYEI